LPENVIEGACVAQSLTERYDGRIAGVLSCYDRVVITGTIPVICYAEGMTRYLHANGIRIFDHPEFAMELRETGFGMLPHRWRRRPA
jgi:hypothetical protein